MPTQDLSVYLDQIATLLGLAEADGQGVTEDEIVDAVRRLVAERNALAAAAARDAK